jgi:type IV pilus assembly protein PilM
MRSRNRSADKQRRVDVVNPDGHVVGLDIGATGIRVVMLAESRDTDDNLVGSHGTYDVPLPDGTLAGGQLADSQTLTRVLRDLWRSGDFGCRQVVLGFSHPQVVVRPIEMPDIPREQLLRALPFRAKDVIALPVDEAMLDFLPVGPGTGSVSEQMVDGLLIAAPRQPLIDIVRAVEGAGLSVARVDLASFGALRAVGAAGPEAEAVIDLGAQMTNIVVHHRGVPRVVRSLPRGGQELTERLADRSGVGLVEAEILKREIGLEGPNPEVEAILREGIRPLLGEIRGSIQYFSTTIGMLPERLVLTGGGAGLPGLADALGDTTGIEVTAGSPLRYLRRAEGGHDDQDGPTGQASAVAVGLAIGAAA